LPSGKENIVKKERGKYYVDPVIGISCFCNLGKKGTNETPYYRVSRNDIESITIKYFIMFEYFIKKYSPMQLYSVKMIENWR